MWRGIDMGGDTFRPLSTEEAKARLRAAAQEASPTAWVRRHPLPALSVALLGGFLAARLRAPHGDGLLLAQKLVAPLLFEAVRRK
jgi:hypothetical protein